MIANKGKEANAWTIKQENLRRMEENSFSVFVDNLPLSMTASWLGQIFRYEGDIIDVFLSRKKRSTTRNPFAFVRFSNKRDAIEASKNLNGMVIRGCSISVQKARFGRFQKNSDAVKTNKEKNNVVQRQYKTSANFFDGQSYKDVLLPTTDRTQNTTNMGDKEADSGKKADGDDKEEAKNIVVYGEANEKRRSELSRSVVGVSIQPIVFNELSEKLKKDWYTIVDIKPIATFKTLVIFESPEEMEIAFKSDYLLNHFSKVKKWSVDDFNQIRGAWIEIFGLPLQAWTTANMEKIVEIWGPVIDFDKKAEEGLDFYSAKILIDTNHFPFIE